jgi:hypothetical protein
MPDRGRIGRHRLAEAPGGEGPAAPGPDVVAGPWLLAGAARPEGRRERAWWWFGRRPDSIVVVFGDASSLPAAATGAARAALDGGASLIETFRAVHDALGPPLAAGSPTPAVALELRADGSVTICSAGAPPLLFCDAGGGRPLVTRGAPLGGGVFVCGVRREQLSPGARILAYSESAVESADASARPFGVRRLLLALEGAGALPAHRAVRSIDAELAAWRGAAAGPDARALLLIEYA